MSPSIHKRKLENIRSLLLRFDDSQTERIDTTEVCAAIQDIEQALKLKRSVVAAHKRVKAKKADKREETAEIRKAVFARAKDLCEMCGAPATDLEHAFGRVQYPQSVANCLALCRSCHVRRTNNRPSAGFWWCHYAYHFRRHGYGPECRAALALYEKAQGRAKWGANVSSAVIRFLSPSRWDGRGSTARIVAPGQRTTRGAGRPGDVGPAGRFSRSFARRRG